MSKSAAVLVVDVNLPQPALTRCKEVCKRLAVDKMVLSRSDELGLVLFGTSATENALYKPSNPGRYAGVVSAYNVAQTTKDFLMRVDTDVSGSEWHGAGNSDFLDALLVAVDLLQRGTGTRKYTRSIYLFSDVSHPVAHKEEICTLIDALNRDGVTLIVVGVDFADADGEEEEQDEGKEQDWGNLTDKATNERVLHSLCAALNESVASGAATGGGGGMVLTVDDALQGVTDLRQRKIAQRPLMKIPMTIGELRIAVEMFTKTQEEKLPTLQKVTADGTPVSLDVSYVSVTDLDKRLAHDDLLRAYKYGKTRIPCTEADVKAMSVDAERGIETVAFVPQEQVPPFVLLGGVKVIGPLPHDTRGTLAFVSIVRAMHEEKKAMIVRLVRTRSSKPALALCVPSCNEKRDVLFMAPLPFAEDVRSFSFSTFSDIRQSQKEEELVSTLVNKMTVESDVLRPSDTFNPTIQQYYETVRSKLISSSAAAPPTVSQAQKTAEDTSEVPPLLEQLRKTSTAFGSQDNVLHDVFQDAESVLRECAQSFPFNEEWDGDKKQRSEWWFRGMMSAENAMNASSVDGDNASGQYPPTVSPFAAAAAAALAAEKRAQQDMRNANEAVSLDGGGSDASTVAHNVVVGSAPIQPSVEDMHVGTVNAKEDFIKIVERSRDSPKRIQRARDELCEVVFKLLVNSVRDSRYAHCASCVSTLRSHCVAFEDPAYFNDFLLKVWLFAKEIGHSDFWDNCIRKDNTQPLITQKECRNSGFADDKAAEAFLSADRSIPAPDLEEAVDDDLLDFIS